MFFNFYRHFTAIVVRLICASVIIALFFGENRKAYAQTGRGFFKENPRDNRDSNDKKDKKDKKDGRDETGDKQSVAGSKPNRDPLFNAGLASPNTDSNVLLAQARTTFTNKNYKSTIKLLKKYLKSTPNNDLALNMMGASYFHLGLGSAALTHLKKNQDSTSLKSYNYYYQGLSYIIIEKPFDAIPYLKKSAEYNDQFGERALFELALVYYHRQEFTPAMPLFRQYLMRYPQGVYAQKALKAVKNIQDNLYNPKLRGIIFPNPDAIIFSYHPWSLFDLPHFWQLSISTGYQEIQEMEPEITIEQKGVLHNSSTLNYLLKARAVFGLGPFKYGDNNLTTGYVYDQSWHTTPERVNTYLEDLSDLAYFPYRPDLLVRRHTFFAEFWRNFSYDLRAGVFMDLFFVNMGSSWKWNTEDTQMQKTLPLSEGHLLIPWVSATITPAFDIGAYTYMFKELNKETNDFSYKTYSLGKDLTLSAGVNAKLKLPRYGIFGLVDLYRYEYIFNDYWSDYRRDGATFNIRYEILPMWSISTDLSLGLFSDTYLIPLVKQGSCSASSTEVSNNEPPRECLRTDSGFMYEANAYWYYNDLIQLSLGYHFVENKNPDQRLFDNNRQEFIFKVSVGFPSLKQTDVYVEKHETKSFLQKEGYF